MKPHQTKHLLVLSDLHLGDGGPADDFHNDEQVVKLLKRFRDDLTVINGDLVDSQQLSSFTAAVVAHAELWRTIAFYVDYIVKGNHDCNLSGIANIPFVDSVIIDGIKFMHGQQFDKFCHGTYAWVGEWATRFAGWCERWIHPDADRALSRRVRKLLGYGRHGQTEEYRQKALRRLFCLIEEGWKLRAIALGHTHRKYVGACYMNSGCCIGSHLDYLRIPLSCDEPQVTILREEKINNE